MTPNTHATVPSCGLEYEADIARALAALRSGQVVVYPTETWYGMGVDALSIEALDRLFALKAREADKPVGLIVHDQDSAFALAREVTPRARLLAERFWPGALTLVLPARSGLPRALIGPGGGVAVRVSSHPLARALAAAFRKPITATSANPASLPPARDITEAKAYFGAHLSVFVDGGRLSAQSSSTLVRADEQGFTILRPGAISAQEITLALSQRAL